MATQFESKILERFSVLPWHSKLKVLQAIEGWTQEQAAEKYGCGGKQIWAWNHGLHYPQRNNRKAIAAAHGLKVTDIFPAEMLKPGEIEKGA